MCRAMIDKALAFLPKSDVQVRLVADREIGSDRPFSTGCIPAVGDRVIIQGASFRCVDRQIEMKDGVAHVTVELKTLPAPQP